MTESAPEPATLQAVVKPINPGLVLIAMIIALAGAAWLSADDRAMGMLWLVGLLLGVTLFHSGFGFTAAWRRLLAERDMTGVVAQMLMLAIAMLLFAPILQRGEVFGHGVVGAVAPMSTSLVIGAFLFGIGMQFASACASGTLFAFGGGNLSMLVVLASFCAGCLLATLHWMFWSGLPSLGAITLTAEVGRYPALLIQLALFGLAIAILYRCGFKFEVQSGTNSLLSRVVQGRWSLLLGGLILAILNWSTLLIAGHPWTITWGFTLWGGKVASWLGWDSASSVFWSSDFASNALTAPLWEDTTSVMNIAIMIGALLASGLGGTRIKLALPAGGQLLMMCCGGLLLGYGARLAYGCNIGAFFGGVATTSLHGWLWFGCALLGNYCGLRLRTYTQQR